MSYGNRGYIAAAGCGLATILFFAGVTYHSSVSSPNEPQGNYREQAEIERRYADAVTENASAPAYAAYPEPNSSDCYKAQNHDSADLCAQWRAAIAAERAANASWWGVFWVVIGTALSGAGLFALLAALNQTERSLREAARANDIAKDNTAIENRAWIFPVGQADIARISDMAKGNVFFHFRRGWDNVGKTPALNCKALSRTYQIRAGEPLPDHFDSSFPADHPGTVIGPGLPVQVGESFLTRDDVAAMMVGATRIIIWYFIEYETPFVEGPCHTSLAIEVKAISNDPSNLDQTNVSGGLFMFDILGAYGSVR